MPKVASSLTVEPNANASLFFIISPPPSNLHGHPPPLHPPSSLAHLYLFSVTRDPRPSDGRRTDGKGKDDGGCGCLPQWGSIFFRFARALAVAMAMAAAMAGSRSRPHLPTCLPQPRRGAYPKNSIDGISYIGRAELEGRPFSPSYSMLGRVLFLLSDRAARLTKLVGAGLRETRPSVTHHRSRIGCATRKSFICCLSTRSFACEDPQPQLCTLPIFLLVNGTVAF